MQLLAGIGPLGLPELLIIAFVVVLIFGVGKLPDVGGAVGKGIREFRNATKDDPEHGATTMNTAADASAIDTKSPAAAGAMSETMFCGECGAKNLRSAKFCAQCGHAMAAPVA